jgi:hypothetical protein
MLSSGSLVQARNTSASRTLFFSAAALLAIAIVALTFGAAKANAAFTISGWGMTPSTTAAAQHPNVSFHLDPDATKGDQTGDDLKTVKVEFAAGMLANPAAVTPCTTAKYNLDQCPTNTNVAAVSVQYKKSGSYTTMSGNMYLITPDPNSVATFGIIVRPSGYQKIFLKSSKVGGIATVRTGVDADYGIDVSFDNIPRTLTTSTGGQTSVTISDITVNLFARTNNSSSNPYFTYSPTRCGAASARATSTSYLGVSDVHTSSWTLTNCSAVQFNPGFTAQMDNAIAGAATGIKATVTLSQTPATTQQSHVKSITTTLPTGTGLNFPAINAVGAVCSDAQLASDTCPAVSQIGTTSVDVPFLPPTMTGKIYLMSRTSMITFGYTLHGSGNTLVVLKGSAAAVDIDGDGMADAVRAYLINLPQAPFTSATLDFDAQLIYNPANVCGSATQTITAVIAGWSGASATRTQTYSVTGTNCGVDTQITSSPASPTSNPTPSFSFVAIPSAGSTFQCSLDAAAFASCTSPFVPAAALSDGSHTFQVRALNGAGVDPTPASATFVVDTVPPVVNIASPAAGALLNSSTVSVAFTATDASAITSQTCAIDGGAPSVCTSPKVYTGLSEGAHVVTLVATDAAGNSAAASRTFTVDTIAPDTTITSAPPVFSSLSSATFSFTSSESPSTFACKLDAGAYVACTSPQSYTSLSSGVHTFAVRATDTAGNTDATPATYNWTPGGPPPDTSITANPTNPSTSSAASFSFTSTATPATFECKLDGAAFAACTSPRSLTGLTDGSHTFQVRSTDAEGSTDGTPASYTWAVDTTPPNTTITSGPPNPSSSSTATFTFTSTEAGSFRCSLDAGAASACTSPKTYTGVSDGAHTFSVAAVDNAGNVDPTPATYTWISGGDPPPPNPVCTVTGSSVSCSWTPPPAPTQQTCSLDGAAAAACTSPKQYNGLAPGTHTFTLCFVDAAGNTLCASRTFTIASPLVLNANCTPSATSVSCTFSATGGTPPYTFSCRLDSAATAACTSPITYTGLTNGSHSITICVTDAAGQSACRTFTWSPQLPPQVTITSPANGSVIGSSTATIVFSVTGGTGAVTTTCAIDGGPASVCTSPKVYTGLANGSHTVTVCATDSIGTTSCSSVSFTTNTIVPPSLSFTSAPGPATASQAPSYAFSQGGSPATFTCQVDGGAATACTSPYVPPTLADQSMHTITVCAANGAGSDCKSTSTWVDTRTYGLSVTATKLANTLTTAANVNSPATHPSLKTSSTTAGAADTKKVAVTLPHGLVAAIAAVPAALRCTDAQYGSTPTTFACPAGSAIGAATASVSVTDSGTPIAVSGSVYLMSAPSDGSAPARLAFKGTISGSRGDIVAQGNIALLNNGTNQQLILDNMPTQSSTGVAFHILSTDVTLNGDVGGAAHPLLTNPSYCGTPAGSGTGLYAPFVAGTNPNGYKGQFHTFVSDAVSYAATTATSSVSSPVTGCSNTLPPYDPTLTESLTNSNAGGTSAMSMNVSVPADQSTTQRFLIKQPPKIGINFASEGTGAAMCPAASTPSTGAAGVGTSPFDVSTCPAQARIGQAKIVTPVFDAPVIADIYLVNRVPIAWFGIHVDPSVTYPGRPAGETNPVGVSFDMLVTGGVPTVHPTCSSLNGDPTCGVGTDFCDVDTQVCQGQLSHGASVLPDVPISSLTLNLGVLADGSTQPPGRLGSNGVTSNDLFTVAPSGDNTCGTGTDPNSPGSSAPFTQSVSGQFTPWSRTNNTGGLLAGTSMVTKSQVVDTPGCNAGPTPDTTITSTPSNPTTLTSANFSFTSTVSPATFECQIDGGAFSACTSPKSYVGLATGNHTFGVRAKDAGGVVDPTPATFSWVISPAGVPNISICGPNSPVVNTSVVPICFVVSGGTPPYTVTCKVDGGAAVACTSPFTITVSDGTHTVQICVTDSVGSSGCIVLTFTVDTTAPDTTIISSFPSPTAVTTANFSFTSSESGSTFACSLDGAAFSSCVSPITYTSLADGSHTFQVRATDSAGNTDPTPATRTWVVDTTKPDTTITSQPSNPSGSASASFTFVSSEPSSTFVCQLDGVGFTPCTSPQSYTALTDGSHTFQVRASDAVGNTDSTPASYTWAIDTTAPDTSITSGPNASGSNASFSFTSTEVGSTFACSLDGAAFSGCTSPQNYTGLTLGTHNFQVRATDAIGNTDPTPASQTWSQVDDHVSITLTSAPGPSTSDLHPTFTWSTTGSPAPTATCSVNGGAAAACTSPFTVNLTDVSMNTISITVSNGVGSASATTSTWADTRPYGASVTVNRLSNSLTLATDVNKPAAHPSIQTIATTQGAADTKTLVVSLPHGLSGSLAAIPANQRCTDAQYGATPAAFACPASSALGVGTGTVSVTDSGTPVTVNGTGYLMTAPSDGSAPARIAVKVTLAGGRGDVVAQGKVNLINNGSTQQAVADNIPTTTSTGVAFHALTLDVTLDGTIGGAAHPLITNQSYCGAPATSGTGNFAPFGPSPQNASSNPNGYKGQFNSIVGNLTSYSATTATVNIPYTVTGCNNTTPPYSPTFTQTLSNANAGSASAVTTTVTQPMNQSTTQRIFVKEPPKIGANFGAFGNASAQCPATSVVAAGVVGVGGSPFDPSSCPATARIGQASITSPLLETPVIADVYLINKTPLPWLGIHVDPTITYPGRPAGETNPAGVTINLLSTTATPTIHPTCSSGNGDANCGIGFANCDTDMQVCQSQITISAPILPDVPLTALTLYLGRLADGTTQPSGRIGVNGITTNDPVTIISAGDNTCSTGEDPNSTGAPGAGSPFVQDVNAQFTAWSRTGNTGSLLAGTSLSNVVSPLPTPGC